MSTSPPARCGTSASIVSSTGLPEGTMIQITRGSERRAQRSRRSAAPAAPCPALAFTASGLRSHTTTSWPPLSRRSVMWPPIRPRPIMASCMARPFSPGRRGRRAEQADVGAHDDVDRKAREEPRHPALRPERGEKSPLAQLRDNLRRDSARKVYPRGGEHGEPQVAGRGAERGHEEVEGPGGGRVGAGHRPLGDLGRLVVTPGERLIDVGETGTGNHPLAGDGLVALREEGMQRELIRRAGREGDVTALRRAHPVAAALPEQEPRPQPGAGAEDGNRAALHRLPPLPRHQGRGPQTRGAPAHRGEVVDEPDVADADRLPQRTGFHAPGEVGARDPAVRDRPGDAEARPPGAGPLSPEELLDQRSESRRLAAWERPIFPDPCAAALDLDQREPGVGAADVSREDSHAPPPVSSAAAARSMIQVPRRASCAGTTEGASGPSSARATAPAFSPPAASTSSDFAAWMTGGVTVSR